ncbi:MAG: hypothetical protein EZS28_015849 [Streblomastix strix]|uniref:Uncharacterized protein n=1 Tax=Streblomastix strix TaxID=222440 RepID=A0A5J4W196_9EUKA|nr:MAG: hypothetical protein EZS28_015849 [Streblomastix strix]
MVDNYLQRQLKLSVRIISSLPGLSIGERKDIYTAVGRTNYYGQFIPQVVTDDCQQSNTYWFANRITMSSNQYVQLVGGQDLYDGLNENSANQFVNLASAIKQIDLEEQLYNQQEVMDSLTYVSNRI